MNEIKPQNHSENPSSPARKELSPEAKRALQEAEQRRQSAIDQASPKEIGGRKGPDPARYGDWEKDGIVSDF